MDFADSFGTPVVMVGDYNSEPNEVPQLYLKGEIPLAGRHVRFVDAHAQYPEWTYTTLQRSPKKRIDFIFVSRSLCVLSASVVPDELSASARPASDHRALIVALVDQGTERDQRTSDTWRKEL